VHLSHRPWKAKDPSPRRVQNHALHRAAEGSEGVLQACRRQSGHGHHRSVANPPSWRCSAKNQSERDPPYLPVKGAGVPPPFPHRHNVNHSKRETHNRVGHQESHAFSIAANAALHQSLQPLPHIGTPLPLLDRVHAGGPVPPEPCFKVRRWPRRLPSPHPYRQGADDPTTWRSSGHSLSGRPRPSPLQGGQGRSQPQARTEPPSSRRNLPSPQSPTDP